jgi:preprotein translocase subunit YajC
MARLRTDEGRSSMQSGGLGNLFLLALPLLLLGFLMWSQRRRTREMAAVQASLTVGDEVMTASGMYGRLVALDEDVATLEVAPGVQVRFDRRAVTRPATAAPVAQPRPDDTPRQD